MIEIDILKIKNSAEMVLALFLEVEMIYERRNIERYVENAFVVFLLSMVPFGVWKFLELIVLLAIWMGK